MKWFKRWFANMCRAAWENSREGSQEIALSSKHGIVRARDEFESDEGLNMQVHRAIGGRIVSFNHYDRKTDRSYRKVYVIQDELDFERELGKIITMEAMRG